jgi:predicted lipoprotein with Yx(FWY)xxD motif
MLWRNEAQMRGLSFCLVAVGAAIVGSGGAVQAGSAPAAALSTPAGIVLIDVIGKAVAFSSGSLWRYLATSAGKPLYTFDADGSSGKATCTNDCAKEFKPYLASSKAKANGDWTLVASGKERQWAYRGQPLYVFDGKDPALEADSLDDGRKLTQDARLLDPSSSLFSPKQGWRRAKFAPEDEVATPSGIRVKSLAVSNGYVIVNQTTDMPLYVMKTAPKNPRLWTPMYAPLVAQPVGDFTVATREDGTRQWAYKGSTLFSFAGDYSPDDLNGKAAQPDVQPALAYENFMPSAVHIQSFPLRGPLLVDAQGKTLYTAARDLSATIANGDKFFVRGGAYRIIYDTAKEVGTRACEGECLKTWRPLLAGPQDQSSGFWEIMDRSEGSRQWAYKGAALYTYVGDEKPGDTNGNAITVPVFGDRDGKIDLSLVGGDVSSAKSGSAWYWHIVTFYN